MPLTEQQIKDAQEAVLRQWRTKPLDELVDHRQSVRYRIDQLQGYSHRSQAQEIEFEDSMVELTALDDLIPETQTRVRTEKLELIRQVADDPANREAGAPTTRGAGAPALVGRAHRSTVRTRTPWQGLDDTRWRSEPMVGRAYDVLEALDDEVAPRQGKERLAELLDDPAEQVLASQQMVSLSDPSYLRAFQSVLRDPTRGHLAWSDEERFAWNRAERVRSMSLGTASMGFALPLALDPSFILTNAGSANPWRRLGTAKNTTSNTWAGVTTTGIASSWLGEGVAASDASPTLNQLSITPQKAAAWVFGSYESVGGGAFDGDVEFASQVGGLFSDAQDRLEESTFTTGAGTGAIPSGFFTLQGTANDVTVAATAARAATDLFSTLEGLTPRYRNAAGVRLAWLTSLTWLDRYRQVPAFSSAVTSIVDDTGERPRTAGIPWYEESSMGTGTGAATRAVAVGDWSQLYVVTRWPGQVLYEPLVTSQATGTVGYPTGQSGWFYLWRSAIGLTTTTAFRVLRFT